ncbi:MAG: hypothetical protein WAO74_10770 [Polaribacter sp.]|uniref:hypothetical protein n=1 Tax=Polaribacter sp. TaxID=1920175 RepID=UPI003BB147F0
MRKIASIILVAFVFTFTVNGQQKEKNKRENKRPKMSVEQHTTLAVKKMTLALDLSEKQQNQIIPLIKAQAETKKANMENWKALKESDKKPSADEIYEMQMKRLDNQIAFKKNMKNILDKEQFEKFEKMAKSRKMKGKKMMMKKGAMKKKKMSENREE